MGAESKATGLDHMDRDAEARTQPQDRPDIGRNVRLEQRQTDYRIIVLA